MVLVTEEILAHRKNVNVTQSALESHEHLFKITDYSLTNCLNKEDILALL